MRRRMIDEMSFVGLVPSTEDIYIAAVRRLAAHCWPRL
jgi:hypothetical protein